MILLTNARTIFRAYDVADPIRIVSYIAIVLVTLVGLYVAALAGPPSRRAGADELVAEDVEGLSTIGRAPVCCWPAAGGSRGGRPPLLG